jgi:hypothetical protein
MPPPITDEDDVVLLNNKLFPLFELLLLFMKLAEELVEPPFKVALDTDDMMSLKLKSFRPLLKPMVSSLLFNNNELFRSFERRNSFDAMKAARECGAF